MHNSRELDQETLWPGAWSHYLIRLILVQFVAVSTSVSKLCRRLSELLAKWLAGGQLADDKDEDMDEAPVQLEAPSKVVTTDTTVNVRARIACFDCQGRSDARSIREILVKVAPQQLILLHGLPQVSIPA